MEAIAAQRVTSNLPPSAGDVSPDLRAELLRMQTLETSALIAIAQEIAPEEDSERQASVFLFSATFCNRTVRHPLA